MGRPKAGVLLVFLSACTAFGGTEQGDAATDASDGGDARAASSDGGSVVCGAVGSDCRSGRCCEPLVCATSVDRCCVDKGGAAVRASDCCDGPTHFASDGLCHGVACGAACLEEHFCCPGFRCNSGLCERP